jgi:hypothetical protein
MKARLQIALSVTVAVIATASALTGRAQAPSTPLADEGRLKSETAVVALYVSGASLFVSALGILITLVNNAWSRRRSVSDDYWLRTVIGPNVVDPLIALIFDTLRDVPMPGTSGAGVPKSTVQKYQHEHQSICAKLRLLAVLNVDLYRAVSEKADDIEDSILNYCGNADVLCRKGQFVEAGHLRSRMEQEALATLNDCLKRIHDYQRKM